MNKNEILRQLPKMDRILQEPEAEELCRLYGKTGSLVYSGKSWTV